MKKVLPRQPAIKLHFGKTTEYGFGTLYKPNADLFVE